ncbi:DUF4062 domain-containing protein [Nitrospira sp. BLG_2]|uniref:DUF4062 domain-containing protein n=1 Tax=Nitrospira sp. BLG_2 TaxID=3397507 RepID=UPI003B9A3B61
MPKEFRVFIASPGDVATERNAVGKAVKEVNETHGEPLGYRLRLVRWETDAIPGAGRPQQVINDQLDKYELFIGVMWRRFGTPTGVAGSGTEEEIRLAFKKWIANPELPIMLYFSRQPFYPETTEDVEQMGKVLAFRKELSGKALVWDYDGPGVFEETVRKHLCLRMNRLMQPKAFERRTGAQVRARGPDETRPDAKVAALLQRVWDRMTPDLQAAFSIAHNENRMAGDGGVKTEDLFAALRRVGASDVRKVIRDIPSDALPRPTQGVLIDKPYIVEEQPWLSNCVASSIKRLGQRSGQTGTITATDVFVDIAKHGTGQSVQLLRKHGIGPVQIDKIIRKNKLKVLSAT